MLKWKMCIWTLSSPIVLYVNDILVKRSRLVRQTTIILYTWSALNSRNLKYQYTLLLHAPVYFLKDKTLSFYEVKIISYYIQSTMLTVGSDLCGDEWSTLFNNSATRHFMTCPRWYTIRADNIVLIRNNLPHC